MTAVPQVPDTEISKFPVWLEAFSARAAHASSLAATMLGATYMMNHNVLAQLREALAKSETLPEEVIHATYLCLHQVNSAIMEAQLMSHDATLASSKLYVNLHLCRRSQVLNSPQVNLSQRDKDRLLLLPIGGNDLFGLSAPKVEDPQKDPQMENALLLAEAIEQTKGLRPKATTSKAHPPRSLAHVSPLDLAKNALPYTIPDPISFPGIAQLFPRKPERLLFPVRVLGLYINRTDFS